MEDYSPQMMSAKRMKDSLQLVRTPKQKRSLQIFESILQAAQEMIESSPSPSENISAIARKAGVGISSFYDYFSSKDGLLHELLRREIEKNLLELERVLSHTPPGDLESYSRSIASHFYSHFFAKKNLMRNMARRVFHAYSNELILVGREIVAEKLELHLRLHFPVPESFVLNDRLLVLVNLYLDAVHRYFYLLERKLVSEDFCRRSLEALALSQINLIFQQFQGFGESPKASID